MSTSIAQTADPDLANRWALLLEALGLPHEIVSVEGVDAPLWELRVEAGHEAQALEHLREEAAEHLGLTRREAALRRERVTLAQEWRHYRFDWRAALAFAVILAATFSAPASNVERGLLDGEAVRSGEWWRIFTALTLHGDIEHLVSNLVAGSLLFGTVSGFFGAGTGFFAVLLAGALGNLLSVWGHPPEYSSLGSSTAIFGAVGLLAGALATGRRRLRFGTALLPAQIGFLLLVTFGVGDYHKVDVTAHLTGFLAGLLCGAVLGFRSQPFPTWAERALVVVGAIGLELVWQLALRGPG